MWTPPRIHSRVVGLTAPGTPVQSKYTGTGAGPSLLTIIYCHNQQQPVRRAVGRLLANRIIPLIAGELMASVLAQAFFLSCVVRREHGPRYYKKKGPRVVMTVLKRCVSRCLWILKQNTAKVRSTEKRTSRGDKMVSQFETCNDPSLQLLRIREGVPKRKVKDLILILPSAKKDDLVVLFVYLTMT